MVKTLEGNLTPTNITTGRGFHFFALLELQLKGESFKTAVEQYFFFSNGDKSDGDCDHFDQIDQLGMDTLQRRSF